MSGKKRRQFFVDATLQGALLARCVFYWGMCLAAVFASLLCWDLAVGPTQIFYMRVENTWFKYAPAMVFVGLLTPVIAFDFMRLSNRFAGPMIRLRRAMRDLGQGERVEPVVLRRSDFWRDFSDEFNSVVLRMRKLEAELAAMKNEPASETAQAMPAGGSTAAYTASTTVGTVNDAADLLAAR